MSKIVGIDLGTTNSAVAYLTAKGPRLIPNALGESLTPSVVGIDLDGNVIVGRTARELSIVHPERTAAVFKRKMGVDWKTPTCRLGKSFNRRRNCPAWSSARSSRTPRPTSGGRSPGRSSPCRPTSTTPSARRP